MLFRTVYGPELESVYDWIREFGPTERQCLLNEFGTLVEEKTSSPANMEDALLFLKTAGVITEKKGLWSVKEEAYISKSFQTNILRKLRSIKINSDDIFPMDPYFIGLVETLYIEPNILYRTQLHTTINSLDIPIPCGEEKVNAWKRVLEYLGVGVRCYTGLLIRYSPTLVMNILDEWNEESGPLQFFLEDHFDKYLPWKSQNGDISKSLSYTISFLESKGLIHLQPKQDLPNKSYLGERKIKWISRGNC